MRVRYDIKGVRYKRAGKIALDNVAPEDFVINRDAKSLYGPSCRFVGHRIKTSESQLIAWGYDPDLVRRVPSSTNTHTNDQDVIIRASQDDSFPLTYADRQDSERSVFVTECYTLVDRDGDGVSEWWKVVVGGDYAQIILHSEPSNGHPFVSVTPIPIPHRFHGLSLADVTGDLQEINTTLWRQYLDCLYLATDPRNIVLSRGTGEASQPMVNLSQLLNAPAGGYIEEYEPGALRPYEQKTNAMDIIPALEAHGKMRESRTGISPEAMGINPDSISKHVYGTMVQSSAAATRITLYARIFADTGVKHLMEKIYMLLMQNDTRGMVVRLRGKYVHVDPTNWATEVDCQVTVGLGHGSKMEKSMNLQTIGEVQKALVELGLPQMVTPGNAFNTVSDLVEALGFRSAEQYFTDPDTVAPPEPEPDPTAEAVKAASEIEFMRVELERQKVEHSRDKLMLEIKKVELAHEIEIQKLRAAGYAATPDMQWTLPKPAPGEGFEPRQEAELPPPPLEQPTPGNGGSEGAV
jgi:beta-phosphoglucomutase-like phosphatase (HAD superfamily)